MRRPEARCRRRRIPSRPSTSPAGLRRGGRRKSRVGVPRGAVVTDRLLTTREVAAFLGLSPETVLRRYRRGELPGFRLGSNVLRFRESESRRGWRGGGWSGSTSRDVGKGAAAGRNPPVTARPPLEEPARRIDVDPCACSCAVRTVLALRRSATQKESPAGAESGHGASALRQAAPSPQRSGRNSPRATQARPLVLHRPSRRLDAALSEPYGPRQRE